MSSRCPGEAGYGKVEFVAINDQLGLHPDAGGLQSEVQTLLGFRVQPWVLAGGVEPAQLSSACM
jgi:hypothetical protein